MQLASTLALLAATSNALAVDVGSQVNQCGNDGYEICRKAVFDMDIDNAGDYGACIDKHKKVVDDKCAND